ALHPVGRRRAHAGAAPDDRVHLPREPRARGPLPDRDLAREVGAGAIRAGRRAAPRQAAGSAAMPARAICASSADLTPETPTAPRQWPPAMIGTPPSSMPCSTGADRNDWRPPLIISS